MMFVTTENARKRIGGGIGLVRFAAAAIVAMGAAFSTTAPAEASEHLEPGEGRVFATLPASPGFPEGIAVEGNHVYVSGPAVFGTAGTGPSEIGIFHRVTGAPVGAIQVQGEYLAAEHALSCITTDGDGSIYALSTQLGTLRFSRHGNEWNQEIYADPLPDLPPVPSSITNVDLPPLSNDIVLDDAGYAYITDSFQATIFRIPPGGGMPEAWFQSPLLEAPPGAMGTNGLRVSPDGTSLYFVVSMPVLSPWQGMIYRLPLGEAPSEADLEVVHAYPGFEVPDGMAFGDSGNLYVALAGSNEISVLLPDGTEQTRMTGAGSSIPLSNPANLAFDERGSLLVTNHAIFSPNPPSDFALIQVYVDDIAAPLPQPQIP